MNHTSTFKHDVLDKGAEVRLYLFDDLGFVAEEFELEGGVLYAHVKNAVAQVLALRKLGAHRSDVFRPPFEQHLLVHQMLLPRLAHKLPDQFFQVHFVVVLHL